LRSTHLTHRWRSRSTTPDQPTCPDRPTCGCCAAQARSMRGSNCRTCSRGAASSTAGTRFRRSTVPSRRRPWRSPERRCTASRSNSVTHRSMTDSPARPLAEPEPPEAVVVDGSARGFSTRLLGWFDHSGRHALPWQHPRTPYRVGLSEIMLQQTQVRTAAPYFERFVAALPDLPALAEAELEQVLALWSGLGYYARARNLHAAARHCMALHDGELPRDIDALVALPGIGRSKIGRAHV